MDKRHDDRMEDRAVKHLTERLRQAAEKHRKKKLEATESDA
jgi:hypothetical protein